jgi:hypothetical protein
MSQPLCGLLPQRLSYDENEVGSPRVMMTSTAATTAHGLAQFLSRPIIRRHNVRQLMKTCLFAFTDIQSVVRADLHPALTSVSVAASPATHDGHRAGASWERSLEPLHPLDGMDVSCAMPIIYYSITIHKHCVGQLADRQACR